MQRRRKISLTKFPEAPVSKEAAVEDVRDHLTYMSRFRDHHVRTVFYLALLGMTEAQMAVVFDIPDSMFQSWKKLHPTFFEALKKGKEQADSQVVYSLYQAAVGYEHDSEQIFCSKEKVFDPMTGKLVKEQAKIIRVPIRKRYAPSVKAALKWLELRQPAQWSTKDNQKQKLTLVQNNFNFADLSLEELKVLQKLQAQTGMDTGNMFHTTAQREFKELN